MSDWREQVLDEHMGPEPDTIVSVSGLDLSAEQFVDALSEQDRDKLVEAADVLKGHQLYIIAVRETINDWKPSEGLICASYLAVVKDVLATAEQILGISYEPCGSDDGAATELPSE